jgi:Flp pilus assembly protein TadD
MTARTACGFRRGALAVLLLAALLGGCASAGQGSVTNTALSSDGLMRMGDKARSRGELPVAAALYRKAHDAEPERVQPLVSLGQVLMEMQRPDQASEAFSAALVVDGRNLDALRGLGNARLALHKPDEAIPPLKEALTSSANDFRVLNALGVAFDMTGDHGSAHQYYRTGLKLAPENAPLRTNYALSLALAGQTDEAVETIEPLAGLPTTAQQRQTMALIYGLAGDTAEAERLALMDLEHTQVKANMERIATLRSEPVPVAEKPKPETVEPETQTAVLSEPLPAQAPEAPAKVEPVALASVARIEPAAAPEPVSATEPPISATPAVARLPIKEPKPQELQVAMASAPVAEAASGPDAATKPAVAIAPRRDAWTVQLASYLKPEQAEKGWRELSAAAPELLADREPLVEQGRLEDESVVWRLRMGPYAAFSEAEGLCQRLRARGLDCFVAPSGT